VSAEAEQLADEILSRHPDWEKEEQEKRDRRADEDSQRWEVGCDHR
jgi:hypothetical protein